MQLKEKLILRFEFRFKLLKRGLPLTGLCVNAGGKDKRPKETGRHKNNPTTHVAEPHASSEKLSPIRFPKYVHVLR